MIHFKETFLWLVLVTAFTPLAFLLVPLVILTVLIGGFATIIPGHQHHIESHK